jgi:CubicO group peptidase (beta-lactamase class C family)
MVRQGRAVRTASDGPKRTSATPPAQDFTVFDWFNPASVTKTITSVAVLQLLEGLNLSIDEPIYKHLPSTWDVGPNVDTITVAELLNHTSGFDGGVTSYADLRAMVEAGVALGDKVDNYSNANTALARIVAVYLDGYDEAPADEAKGTSDHFIALVQRNVFDRLGIPGVTWKAAGDCPTLFYPDPTGTSGGTAYGDWTLRPGSAGAHVSIAELSTFVNALTNDTLLPAHRRAEMDEHGLGLARHEDVEVGWYHRKGGFFPGSMNGGAELHSGIWKFSTGVQAVVLNNGAAFVNMAQAYDDAWIDG